MAAEKEEAHRPSAFKQQNKIHKTGRHRSKGQLDKDTKGRVNVKSLSRRSAKKALNRQQRRNQALQLRKNKRDEILNRKRSRGGSGSPPILVTVVCLTDGVDTGALLKLLETCDDTAIVRQNDLNVCHIGVPRFKQRYEFVCPDYGNLYALLDAVKVADCLLFVLNPHDAISSHGELCLSTVFAQGLPASITAIQGLKELSVKKQGEVRHLIQKRLEKRFPQEKLHGIDTSQDALVLLRTIGNQKLKSVAFRDTRPHMMAEDLNFELTDDQSTTGTLKVTGYLRGRALSVNGLVHLPGWGDFQMSQIDAAHDPNTLTVAGRKDGGRKGSNSMEVETEEVGGRLLERADPGKQESLQSEVIPDPMDGEQTWPTEDELALAQQAATEKKKMKRLVPKGTSEYQAAWIIEEEEEEDDNYEDEEDDDEMEGVQKEESSSDGGETEDEEQEELDTISVTDSSNVMKYDATIDMDEERQFLEKLQQARSDQMFPDEMDTPQDGPARVRFQRYRGLKSFRTSPWDAKENLPQEYAKIFQFGNFRRTCRRVLAEKNEDGAQPGWYITVHIQDVPREFMESYTPGHPVVVFGLLPHEQKMSVVNMMVRPVGGSSCLLKSKERVIFHVGCRRFVANPIYSEHTNGDKYKYERFLQQATVVATVYAPITFPPAGVLLFKEKTNGEHELVATGSLLSVNPDRVIIKRIVLSGHPFKINAKSATVRYLFFNREDIAWFMPVELRTKWGRRGHIKEPLGTHGHMKCIFDGQLKSQDTILMNLYKRVFPKWTYEGVVRTPVSSSSALHSSSTALRDIAMNEMFD